MYGDLFCRNTLLWYQDLGQKKQGKKKRVALTVWFHRDAFFTLSDSGNFSLKMYILFGWGDSVYE